MNACETWQMFRECMILISYKIDCRKIHKHPVTVLASPALFGRFMDLEIKETTYVNALSKIVLKSFNVLKSSL